MENERDDDVDDCEIVHPLGMSSHLHHPYDHHPHFSVHDGCLCFARFDGGGILPRLFG
jgi:hypothetical protein